MSNSVISHPPSLLIHSVVHLSKPEISLSVFKEGTGYRGNVTCWSSRGTVPANFSLLVDDETVASVVASDSVSAWFSVPVVPGLDMGVAQCWVKNEVQELMSEPLTLEVGMSYSCVGTTLIAYCVLFCQQFIISCLSSSSWR